MALASLDGPTESNQNNLIYHSEHSTEQGAQQRAPAPNLKYYIIVDKDDLTQFD